jgi:RNA-binding protein
MLRPGTTAAFLIHRRPNSEGMTGQNRDERIHNLDVTVWVGKNGIEAVAEELADQLADRTLVKVKFLRAARGKRDTETLAVELAGSVGATVVETRGHTAVIER